MRRKRRRRGQRAAEEQGPGCFSGLRRVRVHRVLDFAPTPRQILKRAMVQAQAPSSDEEGNQACAVLSAVLASLEAGGVFCVGAPGSFLRHPHFPRSSALYQDRVTDFDFAPLLCSDIRRRACISGAPRFFLSPPLSVTAPLKPAGTERRWQRRKRRRGQRSQEGGRARPRMFFGARRAAAQDPRHDDPEEGDDRPLRRATRQVSCSPRARAVLSTLLASLDARVVLHRGPRGVFHTRTFFPRSPAPYQVTNSDFASLLRSDIRRRAAAPRISSFFHSLSLTSTPVKSTGTEPHHEGRSGR
ncbi:hypothetical protein K438DRAFT_715847 [Mycena galopus ATCC 62051]|nr:hypothetical protein K438DRAFT_715847 [Mycena galopus ATCC 62051]